MTELLEQLYDVREKIEALRGKISDLLAHRGNSFYRKKYDECLIEVDKTYKLFKSRIAKIDRAEVKNEFQKIDGQIMQIFQESGYEDKLAIIKKLPMLWNDLEIAIQDISLVSSSILTEMDRVPTEIYEEVKGDMEEAISCLKVEAYRSSIIMAARALEVCLHRKYFEATGKDLLESNAGIGTLLRKLNEEKIVLMPGTNHIFNLSNDCRINSVHKKKSLYLPKAIEATSIIQLVNSSIAKLW